MVTVAQEAGFSPMTILKDMRRLRLIVDDKFFKQLNETTRQRKEAHDDALATAAAKHERVRQDALQMEQTVREMRQRELARIAEEESRCETLQKEIERETQRFEQVKREREELERSLHELTQRCLVEEAERKRKADAFQAQQAAAAAAAKDAEEEKARQATIRQAEEEKVRRSAAQQTELQRAQDLAAKQQQRDELARRAALTAAAARGASFQPDPLHPAYLEVHQRLKQLRTSMVQFGKRTPELNRLVGDTRREIRKCIGQFVVGKGVNKIPTANLMNVLRAARADTQTPRIDVRRYIVLESMPPSKGPMPDPRFPAIFIYALNILAKSVVSQWANEASVQSKKADPIGVVAVQAFAAPLFSWGQRSLIDILIAKMHFACPVLFGISGDDRTDEGKARLGWERVEKGGAWCSEQRHGERMTGLGAGFASISLRNFRKSAMSNPYPNWKFWQSLYWITMIPTSSITATHYIVLKAMLQDYLARFIEFFGSAALPALTHAILHFPRRSPVPNTAANALSVLPDILLRDHHTTLNLA